MKTKLIVAALLAGATLGATAGTFESTATVIRVATAYSAVSQPQNVCANVQTYDQDNSGTGSIIGGLLVAF